MQRLLNPKESAYRSETGGLMEALRVLTVEKSMSFDYFFTRPNDQLYLVREYHHKYYVPHNLSLIVTGKLASGTSSLLNVVQTKVEPSLVAHGQKYGPRPPGWKRPFLETASSRRGPIQRTVKETVEFPEKDESVGELQIGFMGPPPNAFLERKASKFLTSHGCYGLMRECVRLLTSSVPT